MLLELTQIKTIAASSNPQLCYVQLIGLSVPENELDMRWDFSSNEASKLETHGIMYWNLTNLVLIFSIFQIGFPRFSRQVKDPEENVNNKISDRESRIVTPSRTILPPHTPHFIYFNPADTITPISPTPARLVATVDTDDVGQGRVK